MCGRYTLRDPSSHDGLTNEPASPLVPRYNIAPNEAKRQGRNRTRGPGMMVPGGERGIDGGPPHGP